MLTLQPGESVLDLGCGIGGSAFHIAQVRRLHSPDSGSTSLLLQESVYMVLVVVRV